MTSISTSRMSTDAGPAPRPHGQPPRGMAPALFVVAALAFVAAQANLWSVNHYWFDEYYSLWAGDPKLPLATLLGERILPDTNPPLFYTLVFFARTLIDDARTAFVMLNGMALVLTIAFVVVTGRRAGLAAWAWAATSLFLVSGPVMAYTSEGRAYLIAMSVVFSMAWVCAVAIDRLAFAPTTRTFVMLGFAAGLIHAYAALMAGALAAGLVLEGLAKRRRALVRIGLTLGGSASLTVLAWLTLVRDGTSGFDWIVFTPSAVREALWFVGQLAVGHRIVGAAILAFLLASAVRTSFRPALRVFGVAATLFGVIPVAVSFAIPIIVGRYWLVGAPALVVLVVFASRAHLAAWTANRRQRSALFAAVAGGVLMVGASLAAVSKVHQTIIDKWAWTGAPLVQRFAAQCGADSIHVWGWRGLHAVATDAPESTFVDAQTSTRVVDAATAKCPVLGWAEHLWHPDDRRRAAQNETLLEMLRIRSDRPEFVQIERHDHGVVVLRADAGVPSSDHR